MNVAREKKCYNALSLVFKDGAYSSLALNECLSGPDDEDGFITRLFYGVLERNVTLEYIISELADKRPKISISIILKMGIYMIRFMNVADYAAVDRCVELCKVLGKGGAGGFVNAVLRRSGSVKLPSRDETERVKFISLNFGLPEWLAEKLIEQYGAEFTEEMMSAQEFRTHIRLSPSFDSEKIDRFAAKADEAQIRKTKYGYYVTHNILKCLTNNGVLRSKDFAVQSLASAAAVHCYAVGVNGNSKVLDLCAAPGGKSVYLKQLTGCDLIACDIHKHRLDLIRSYASRMEVDIDLRLNDACVENADWNGKFDCVICDVPCSGSGDLRSKPDILLRRSADGVTELKKLQSAILRRAAGYVKEGGKLCYSTCSIFSEENEEVVRRFLEHNADFAIEDSSCFSDELRLDKDKPSFKEGDDVGKKAMKLFPHIHGCDGFFAVALKKAGNGNFRRCKIDIVR